MTQPFRPGDRVEVGKVLFEVIGVGMEILTIRPLQLVWRDGAGMTLNELYALREQFGNCQAFIDELAPIIARFERIDAVA